MSLSKQLLKEIRLHTKKIYDERLILEDKKRLLKTICKHEEVEVRPEYISGSYFDRAQYIKITSCTICGKTLKEEREYGSYE